MPIDDTPTPPAGTPDPAWETLRRDIVRHAVRFADNVVFDFRLLLSDPQSARSAGRLMWRLIRPFAPDVLVGPGFGAAPLLFATAAAALDDGVRLPTLMVRDRRKAHHQKRWVEGRRQADHARAVMIDDFMEAGSALPLVEQALRSDGHVLDLVAVGLFFDMWQPLGSRQIATARMPVVSVFKRHDIGLSRDCFDARPPAMRGGHPDFIEPRPLWWRFDLNVRTDHPLKCVPAIALDSVFVADDRCRVWRLDALTGDVQWRVDSLADPRKGIVQRLQVVDRSLVFGCYDGTLTRLDAEHGRIRWRWRLDSSIHATPEIDLDGGRVFINTEQWNHGAPFGHLLALDWETGRVLWRHVHPWWPPGSPVHSARADAVIATCNDRSVVAVGAGDGRPLWRRKTRGLVRGRPALHADAVLLATEAGWLHCLDANTGATRWEKRYGRGAMHQFLHVQDDLVFTLDGRWHLVAFDVHTGDIVWMSRLRSAGNWCPVVCGRHLVVLSRAGHLAVFDPARRLKVWEGTVGIASRQPPAIGRCGDATLLAVAGNADGLQTYRIHPDYTHGLATSAPKT
jgi:outer membrane protein assembly factor BamB/orotate phosphoribosyltransferase